MKKAWKNDFNGNPMFNLLNKLKRLKRKLKKMNRKDFW